MEENRESSAALMNPNLGASSIQKKMGKRFALLLLLLALEL